MLFLLVSYKPSITTSFFSCFTNRSSPRETLTKTAVGTIKLCVLNYQDKGLRGKLNRQPEITPLCDMVCGDYLPALLSAASNNIEVLFHLHRCSFPFCFRQIAAITYSLLLESGPQMWSSSSARLTLTRISQNICYPKHNVPFAIHNGRPTCTLIIVIYKKPRFVWFFESGGRGGGKERRKKNSTMQK